MWGRDARGNRIYLGNSETDEAQKSAEDTSCNLILTIDSKISEHIVESRLKAAVEQKQAKGGSVIVMDIQTGEILALANMPLFNLECLFGIRSRTAQKQSGYRLL